MRNWKIFVYFGIVMLYSVKLMKESNWKGGTMGMKEVKLDPKLLNMILFFITCDCGTHSKVALMKYLFYSDFTFYRDYGKAISQEQYVHMPNGPGPDNWKLYLSYLLKEGLIKEDKRKFITPEGIKEGSYYFIDRGVFADTLFDKEEIERMKNIYSELSKYNSRQLSQLTHNEAAWLKSLSGKTIDLKYAFFIDLLETEEDDENKEIPPEVNKAMENLERSGII
jgi:uncharacterized phage-associated protein